MTSQGTLAQDNDVSKCPFHGGALKQSAGGGTRNRDWWPNQLKLNILRQHSSLANSMLSFLLNACCVYISQCNDKILGNTILSLKTNHSLYMQIINF